MRLKAFNRSQLQQNPGLGHAGDIEGVKNCSPPIIDRPPAFDGRNIGWAGKRCSRIDARRQAFANSPPSGRESTRSAYFRSGIHSYPARASPTALVMPYVIAVQSPEAAAPLLCASWPMPWNIPRGSENSTKARGSNLDRTIGITRRSKVGAAQVARGHRIARQARTEPRLSGDAAGLALLVNNPKELARWPTAQKGIYDAAWLKARAAAPPVRSDYRAG